MLLYPFEHYDEISTAMISVYFPWCKNGSHRQLAGCLKIPGCGFCHSPLTALFMLRVQTEALSSGGPSRLCVRMKGRGALTKVSMVTQRSVTHAAANVSHFPKVSVCLYVSVSFCLLISSVISPSHSLQFFSTVLFFPKDSSCHHFSICLCYSFCETARRKGHIKLAAHYFTQHRLHAFVN